MSVLYIIPSNKNVIFKTKLANHEVINTLLLLVKQNG